MPKVKDEYFEFKRYQEKQEKPVIEKNSFLNSNNFLNELRFDKRNDERKPTKSKERVNYRMNFNNPVWNKNDQEKFDRQNLFIRPQANNGRKASAYRYNVPGQGGNSFAVEQNSFVNFGGRRGNISKYD